MVSRARRILQIVLPLFIALPLLVARAEEADLARVRKTGLAKITSGRAKKHLYFLAGIKCEGRGSGLKGCDVAADYLIEALKEAGFEAGGSDGYRQTFELNAGPFPGQGRRSGQAPASRQPSSNVIGVLKGSDPALAKELVIVGAHYDHVGFRDLRKRKVYWGADDNASGTTALLLVAEAMAACSVRPRRSIMFLFFTGEERGLLGSKHYVSQPTWPIRDTVAMINMDMVGRNEPSKMDVYGNRSSPELDAANSKFEKQSRFRFEFKGGSIFSRSDHYSFYEKGIPVLFFTSGLHKDYHGLKDEPRRINFGKVERIAEHSYRLLWEIGNLDQRPTYQKIAPSGAAGMLGLVPMPIEADEIPNLKLGKGKGAVAVTDVMRGTPAEKAKVKKGDLVLGLAGKMLTDQDPMGELDKIADGLKKRKKYPLRIRRDGRKKTLVIEIE